MSEKIIKKAANGWLIIYTKGLTEANFKKFKDMMGDPNPSKESWMALPSEYIDRVEYVPEITIEDFEKYCEIMAKYSEALKCEKIQ